MKVHRCVDVDVDVDVDACMHGMVFSKVCEHVGGGCGAGCTQTRTSTHQDLEFLRELKRLGFSFRKLPASELHPKWQAEEIGVFAIQRAAGGS